MTSKRETVEYIINPLTDRKIKVHSRTYKHLVKNGIINNYLDEQDVLQAINEYDEESESEEFNFFDEEPEPEEPEPEESEPEEPEEPESEQEEEQDFGGAGDNTPEMLDDLTDDDVNKLYEYVNLLRNKNKYK